MRRIIRVPIKRSGIYLISLFLTSSLFMSWYEVFSIIMCRNTLYMSVHFLFTRRRGYLKIFGIHERGTTKNCFLNKFSHDLSKNFHNIPCSIRLYLIISLCCSIVSVPPLTLLIKNKLKWIQS